MNVNISTTTEPIYMKFSREESASYKLSNKIKMNKNESRETELTNDKQTLRRIKKLWRDRVKMDKNIVMNERNKVKKPYTNESNEEILKEIIKEFLEKYWRKSYMNKSNFPAVKRLRKYFGNKVLCNINYTIK